MTVYVDDYRVPARVGRINARWSHMMADTLPELLAFADQLGLRRSWLQDKASGVHFDVTDAKRAEALRLGALPLECGSEPWSRVLDEARQQFSGEKRPRRFPLPAAPTGERCKCNPAEVENGVCLLCGKPFLVGGAV